MDNSSPSVPLVSDGNTTVSPTEVAASTGTPALQSTVDQVANLAQTAAAIISIADPKDALIIALVSGLIDLTQKAIPAINDLVSKGSLTVDQVAAVRAQWNDFVAQGNQMFDQPQWQVS